MHQRLYVFVILSRVKDLTHPRRDASLARPAHALLEAYLLEKKVHRLTDLLPIHAGSRLVRDWFEYPVLILY